MTTSLAAVACLLAVAACGGSSKPTSKPKRSPGNAMLAMSKCMRAHGVTHFPDPNGQGINLGGTGVNPRSPAFQAAQKICFKLMPGGGPQGHPASAQAIASARATAECMRQHGVTGFPDPIVSQEPPTSLNPANYSIVEAGGGLIIAVPRSINPSSPVFQKAAKACGFR